MPAQEIPNSFYMGIPSGGGSTAAGKSFTLSIPLPVHTTGNANMPSGFQILTRQLIHNSTATTGLQLERGQDFPRGDGNL